MMKELTINDLPDEILKEIFSYLPTNSLIQKMEVCKRFNEIIGRCSKLMVNVQICFDGINKENLNFVMESKRKYKNLRLRNVIGRKSNELIGGLGKFISTQKNLTYMMFENCTVTSSEMGLIIDMVRENLEDILLLRIDFSKNNIAVPLNFPKLKSITISDCKLCSTVTDYFKNAPVQEFYFSTFDDYPLSAEELQKFAELFISWEGLKDMECNYDLSQEIFSNGFFANAARFKLDRLALDMGIDNDNDDFAEIFNPAPYNHAIVHPVATDEHYENFCIFLNKQRCLKKLILHKFTIRSDLLELILGINGLKDLFLEDCSYQILRKAYVQSTSIESLHFNMNCTDENIELNSSLETGICETIRCCSAITRLRFGLYAPTENICTTILGNLKHLTYMQMKIRENINVTLTTVKTLVIGGDDADEKILAFLRMNRQLKHVEIETRAINDLQRFKNSVVELDFEKIDYY